MLNERDEKIIRYIENYGFVTISQCYKMFFYTDHVTVEAPTGRDISPGRERTTIRGGGQPRSLWAPHAGTRQGTQGPIPWGRLNRDLQERSGRGTWGLGPPGMLGGQDGGMGWMTS